MRGAWIVVLMALLLVMPVRAESEWTPPGLGRVYETAQDWGVEPDTGLEEGVRNLFAHAAGQLGELLGQSIRTGGKLLAVAVLCALARSVCRDKGKTALSAVELAGALGVTALTMQDMGAMVGLGREVIRQMSAFSQLLLPVMATLTAVTGQVGAAAARQGATVLFSILLIRMMDLLLVPLVYAYAAVCCAHTAVGGEGLKKTAQLIRNVVTWLLTILLLLFVGYLTVSGAVAGSADAAAVKTAKLAISRAIPVVGGILADTAESVLAGASALRGSVGLAGLLVTLSICLIPFFQLALHYLIYRGVAALAGMTADLRLCGLIDNIGSAFGLVLGMTGASALILLISLICTVCGGNG